MSLPFDYSINCDCNTMHLIKRLQNSSKINILFFSKDKILLNFKIGFLGLSFDAEILINNENSKIYVKFFLEKILAFSFFISVFVSFIVNSLFKILIWSSSIFFLVYLVSILFISWSWNFFVEEEQIKEGFTDEQLKWIDDKSRCPACGASICEFDQFCPQCQINLQKWRNVIPQKNVSRTNFFDKKINYVYKK